MTFHRFSVGFLMLGFGLPAPTQVADAGDGVLPIAGPSVPELAPFDNLLLDFLNNNHVPGAAVAIAKDGQLIYHRGFGWADADTDEKMMPAALFRIASISKPITAVAILLLVEQGKLRLEDRALDYIALEPTPGNKGDPRLKDITIRQLLEHTAGFDRAKSYDPMFRPVLIARELGVEPPAGPEQVIRHMLGQPLDFAPGARYAYSNFGYCLLGRVIEKVSGQSYEAFVRESVLKPIGASKTRLGKTLERAPGEVVYKDAKPHTGPAIMGPDFGKDVPTPYGAWHLEAMDAHGGWISSADDLVRFAAALDVDSKKPLLKRASIEEMFAYPADRASGLKAGQPLPAHYSLGWSVRPQGQGRNTWHTGALDGTATLLVRRHNGLAWAVLFNSRNNAKGEYLATLIDPLMHQAAAKVTRWPTGK